jgi:NAD+--asparagine ADP-ribosyltransferase
MGSWENIYTKQLTINYRIGIRSSAYSTTAYIQLYKNGVLIKEFSSSDYNNIKYYTDTINVNIGENIEAYGWIEGGE